MKTSEILEAGLALIVEKEHWVQGRSAVTKEGMICSVFSPGAYSFCSIGALSKVLPDRRHARAEMYLRDAMNGSISGFNDTYSHEEVVAAWRKAIARVKELERWFMT